MERGEPVRYWRNARVMPEVVRPEKVGAEIAGARESLLQGLIFAPDLRTLYDPISGLQGVADGTTYDAATDSRVFNGTTDRVDWPSIRNVNGEPITISIWCYLSETVTNMSPRPFMIAAPPGTNDGLYMFVRRSDGRLIVADRNDDGDSAIQQATGRTWENQWVHALVTYTGSNDPDDMAVAYDGVAQASAAKTESTGTPREKDGLWSIGGAPSADTVNWIGRLAAPMVWSRVLTAAEQYNLYQMTGPR